MIFPRYWKLWTASNVGIRITTLKPISRAGMAKRSNVSRFAPSFKLVGPWLWSTCRKVNLAVTRITTVRMTSTLARKSSSGSLTHIHPLLPQTMLLKNVDATHCVQEATSKNVSLLSTRHPAVRKNGNEKRMRRNLQFYETRWVYTTPGYPYWPATSTCSSSLDLTEMSVRPTMRQQVGRQQRSVPLMWLPETVENLVLGMWCQQHKGGSNGRRRKR